MEPNQPPITQSPSTPQFNPAVTSPTTPKPRRKQWILLGIVIVVIILGGTYFLWNNYKQDVVKKGIRNISPTPDSSVFQQLITQAVPTINAKKNLNSRNSKRTIDVNAILNAIAQYQAANSGNIPTGITSSIEDISTNGANICSVLVPLYIQNFPVDPGVSNTQPLVDCSKSYDTHYTIVQSATDHRITVAAPEAENGVQVSATR